MNLTIRDIFNNQRPYLNNANLENFIQVSSNEAIVFFNGGKKVLYNANRDSMREIFYIDEYELSDKQIISEFVIRLNTMLEDSDVTKEKIAKLLGIDKNTLYRYCNGETLPDILILCRLAKVLNCRIQDFYYTEQEMRRGGLITYKDEYIARLYLSDNLNRYIKSSRLGINGLADYLGVSTRTVYRYCEGQTIPDIVTYKRIVEFLNKNVEDLLLTEWGNY